MSKFSTFIELLIKQTCRRASHEFETSSRQSNDDSSSIYSLGFLKSLYDKPRDNIHKLFKATDNHVNNSGTTNGLNWLNTNEFSKVEGKRLLDFLNKVKDMSPSNSQKWVDLQHYMHYAYRNFANANPDPSAEDLSSYFTTEMLELVESLMDDDVSQVFLRITALLREYCIFAHWNYCKSDGEHSITRLFYYYEAMLSAAKNLSLVFTELEMIIFKYYSVCWIDFNTCVFIRYFFETEFVQTKIYQCLETKTSRGDTPAMFGLLEDLKNLWIREQKRIKKLNEDAAYKELTSGYYIEEAMISSHKKVLTSNFWVQRSDKEKEDLVLGRLDHQLFCLLADPTFHPAGPIMDRNGQCICEECLIAKYKYILDFNQDQFNDKILKNMHRLLYCRRCQVLMNIESFHRHINSHALDLESTNSSTNLTRVISEKIDFVNVANEGLNMNDWLTLVDASNEDVLHCNIDKNLNPKIASVFTNTADIQLTASEIESGKAFQEFIKRKKEAINNKTDQFVNKNVRNLIKIKKDIFNHKNGNFSTKVFDNVFKQSPPSMLLSKKCEFFRDTSELKSTMPKAGFNWDKVHTLPCKPSVASKSNCEHTCKLQEESKPSMCQAHGSTGDNHQETKKCDCTYCEVFGMSSVTHKNSELRDRLRVRLHQRREKRTKDTCKNAPATVNTNISVKVKSIINKVEERVPLPPSPTNIPPAPTVKSSDSPVVTSSAPDDIHGLVNYIEGNTDLNKLELAEKKAAKKARQRMKKEEERIQAEEEQKRIAEELKRKEEEKKKEIARKLEEKELARKLEEKEKAAQYAKKKSKKDRQAEKRLHLQQQAQQVIKRENTIIREEKAKIVEETIPAMVTIKRVAENGNSSPTVTITLKGSTPDQDKLLYTLVNGSDDSSTSKSKENESNNNNINSKKKKKQKQQNNEAVAPKVVTKELKVTVAMDANKSDKNAIKPSANTKISANKQKGIKKNHSVQDDLPMLNLPPGITITKVEGPVTARNYYVSNMENRRGSSIGMGKSGVIVVDTEKLIQDKESSDSTHTKSIKKIKKKKSKNQGTKSPSNNHNSCNNSKKMVTLKNPIFQNFQVKSEPPQVDKNTDSCAPAAIFTNENGMVTIRSSRLQQSLSHGSSLNPMPVMPVINSLDTQSKSKPNYYVPNQQTPAEEKNEILSPFNAQQILSGLPGIEITKVDKKAVKPELDANKSSQTAQVSIIPASNNGDKFNFDKDDWLYDSVFSPKDVLEDDMDAEELELEAFKRFCQQSVPPKRKEKVAHLNLAELVVLKKKPDSNTV